MAFENSLLPLARRVLPHEVLECYDFELQNSQYQSPETALTPECQEAWTLFFCLQQFYKANCPDFDKKELSAPKERHFLERELYNALVRWGVAIQALEKAKHDNSLEAHDVERLARRQINDLQNDLNRLAARHLR